MSVCLSDSKQCEGTLNNHIVPEAEQADEKGCRYSTVRTSILQDTYQNDMFAVDFILPVCAIPAVIQMICPFLRLRSLIMCDVVNRF